MEASIEVKVPFYDLDPMRVVWHGNYIKYFERARCALLEKMGLTYPDMGRMGYVFPVVKLNVKYVKPAVFNQPLKVEAILCADESYLRIKYLVLDAATSAKLCEAETCQMCVSIDTSESFIVLPKEVLAIMESAK